MHSAYLFLKNSVLQYSIERHPHSSQSCAKLFPSDRLKTRLDSHTVANFVHHARCDVSNSGVYVGALATHDNKTHVANDCTTYQATTSVPMCALFYKNKCSYLLYTRCSVFPITVEAITINYTG